MERFTIHISQSHIDHSTRGDPSSCMIANALRQQLDLGDDADVHVVKGNDIEIEGFSVLPVKEQRRTVGLKISAFDSPNRQAKPFSFELELPDGFRARLNELRRWRRTAR